MRRFIGSKERLLPKIESILMQNNALKGTACDIFTGTTNVARLFKRRGLKVISNDTLYFSYVFQKAYIKNNNYPDFTNLILDLKLKGFDNYTSVLGFLNKLDGTEGFIYNNYSMEGTKNKEFQRMYYNGENAKKIDVIRQKIESWKNDGLVAENEYYILLASLIVSANIIANISGTYGAFLKHWDPRTKKTIKLSKIEIIRSDKKHEIYQEDANKLIRKIKSDLLYIDPPYNERQYITNYHLLETIARYDNPKIYGKTGLRPYLNQKSLYCNKSRCLPTFRDLILNANTDYILVSYNTDGIISEDGIISVLSEVGRPILFKKDFARYRSDNGNNRKYRKDDLKELLFFVKVRK